MSARSADKPDVVTLALFAAIVLIAGGNPVAVRFSNAELEPYWGAAVRFLVASVVLFAIVFARRLELPRGRALAGTLLYGLLSGFGFFALVYTALNHLRASVVAPVMASVPLITFFLAVAHGVERFRARALLGGVTSIAGIVMLSGIGRNGEGRLGYIMLVVAASVCAAEGSIVLKKFPRAHPIVTNAIAMGLTGVLLMALSFGRSEARVVPEREQTWIALTFLTFIGTALMFVLYVVVVSRWEVSRVSYQFVLFPIVSVVLAAWLAGDPITASLAYGGALVIAGVYVGALSHARPAPVPAPSPEVAHVPCTPC